MLTPVLERLVRRRPAAVCGTACLAWSRRCCVTSVLWVVFNCVPVAAHVTCGAHVCRAGALSQTGVLRLPVGCTSAAVLQRKAPDADRPLQPYRCMVLAGLWESGMLAGALAYGGCVLSRRTRWELRCLQHFTASAGVRCPADNPSQLGRPCLGSSSRHFASEEQPACCRKRLLRCAGQPRCAHALRTLCLYRARLGGSSAATGALSPLVFGCLLPSSRTEAAVVASVCAEDCKRRGTSRDSSGPCRRRSLTSCDVLSAVCSTVQSLHQRVLSTTSTGRNTLT